MKQVRRLPPLRLLAVFEAVQRCKGVQSAAQELNVSQPAVSQAMKQLEAHVGQPLFDRRTRPASLTAGGQILQRAVSEGFDRIAAAIDELRSLQAEDEASLTVACTVGTATYWLMPSLTGFHEIHGDIAVSVRTTSHSIPRVLPGVDLAIRYGLPEWGDGIARQLFRERVVPVCAPGLWQRLQTTGFDLAKAPLLHVDAEISDWMEWPEYLRRTAQPPPARSGIRFTNYVQATQAAVSGLGVMLGWRSNVASLLRNGELVELPLPAIEPQEAFYLIEPGRRSANAAPRALLVEWLLRAGAELETP
ncbi:LysR family transcriptional regulator [Rhodobacter sp. 140A]|nr:LysR family transcriptional regulator [Rhodobacter sp. 140A]